MITDPKEAYASIIRDAPVVYNECETCGANDGDCGNVISSPGNPTECLNCYHTRRQGEVVLHAYLFRTDEQIQRTMAILDEVSNGT